MSQGPTIEEIQSVFSEEEMKDLMARSDQLGLTTPEARMTFVSHRYRMKRQELDEATAAMRGSESFQTGVVRQQLPAGAGVALDREAGGFGRGVQQTATPLLGGLGGSATLEGEVQDVRAQFPGRDVRAVSMPTAYGDQTSIMVQDENGTYVPVNAPGLSLNDVGRFTGDFFTLESVGSLVPFIGPASRGRVIARALKSAGGAAAGGSGDALLDANEEAQFATVAARAAAAGGSAFIGEGISDMVGRTINFAGGRSSVVGTPSGQRAAQVQALGAPVYAGQVTPNSWIANMRRRWSNFDPVLKEQVMNQNLWMRANLEDVASTFRNMDGVDQALVVGGIDLDTLAGLEQEYRNALAQRATIAIQATGRQSRSGAGRDVQEALFGLNKDTASYRTVANAYLNRLEENLLDTAEQQAKFSIDLTTPIRTAQNARAAFPVLQTQPNRIAGELETGRDVLGAGVRQVRAKHAADLNFVLKTLAELPEPAVLNRATYRVRVGQSGNLMEEPMQVDGNGDLRVPFRRTQAQGTAVARPGETTAGSASQEPTEPVIGTYDLNGVEMVRMLRGKLRDFFGNPLIPPGDRDAVIAKNLYRQLGESLEAVQGAPDFVDAVRKYNRSAYNYMSRMEQLQTAKLAQAQDAQSIVTQFTGGAMGYETLATMKQTLTRAAPAIGAAEGFGETAGPAAWQGFRNAAARDLIANPEKIKNLTIEPKTTSLMFDEKELGALQTYGTAMETLTNQGFEAVARRASGVRGRALSLFGSLPDERQFAALWGRMSDVDQNVMRVAVIEDLLNRSTTSAGGVVGQVNPAALERNIADLLNGDRGVRARAILPPETIKALQDQQTIAAFYREVQGLQDAGQSIAAAEVASGVQRAAQEADLPGVAKATMHVLFNKMLAGSLADGTLSRLFAPRLREPWNFAKAQAFATMAVTALNNDEVALDSELAQETRARGQAARTAVARTRMVR